MKSKRTLKGLLLEETPSLVRLAVIEHRAGEEPKPILTPIARNEIDHIERLAPEDRRRLRNLLKELQPATEDQRMQSLRLTAAPANCGIKGAVSYRSAFFVLVGNVHEDIFRRAAVRLEKIYQAYARYLPPRVAGPQPTTILIVQPLAEYQALLERRGRRFLNPAYYDCSRNEVLCACELQQLEEKLTQTAEEHRQLRARLAEQEKLVRRQFIGKVLHERLTEIDQSRAAIRKKDEDNKRVFGKAARRFYQILYHEAFHSYLANYVYEPDKADVPHWLNEGLAQIFETAVVEGDELIVDRPDADGERYRQVMAALQRHSLPDMEALLLSGPKQFQVGHTSNQRVSDQYYLMSWAVACYLTFGCQKLSTPAMDQYVAVLKSGTNPVEAFKTLVDQPLPVFEKALQHYFRNLVRSSAWIAPPSRHSPPLAARR
jgi:hypothetical protein